MNSKIKQLSPSLVAQIAAGEVIDRPGAVIKELIDNSLDAQATTIKIELENAGQKQIKLTDNGHGMSREDLRLCYLPHTTSKIINLKQLANVQTLGFRGEALASMASVARLSIASKLSNQTGHQLIAEDNKLTGIKPIGTPTGTQITLDRLFSLIPARKKFLKKPATELKFITNLIIKYALIYPQISFVLINNKKTIIDFPATQNWAERITDALGRKTASHLIPIEYKHSIFKIKGMIGDPQIARDNKNQQFLYVNQRPVVSSRISKTIKHIYGGLLEPKAQPTFILHLSLPPSFVDVNIDPNKKTVKFWDEDYLIHLLTQIIRSTLIKTNLLEGNYHNNYPDIEPDLLEINDNNFQNRNIKANQYLSKSLKDIVQAWETTQTREDQDILQLHDLYLLTQTANGLLLIDQHAAHERILYQQFLDAYQKQAKGSKNKQLKKPIIIELSLADDQILEQNLKIFNKIGFQLEKTNQQTYKITQVPNNIDPQLSEKIILETIDDLINLQPPREIDTISKRTLSFLACRSAIKAGDSLSQQERKNLVKKLAETDFNYTCPHGRPSHVVITLDQLEKMFHRR